ncbi:MAG TPA: diguanylate cyclase [Thermoanaerobaculia bacterium]|jgi:diguanylate cyclase (GGDEF)-like protein|nr:diguanylate cyclase [Thermoanaerobaculia bacterium]
MTNPLRRRNDLPPDPPAESIRVLIVEDDENFSVWLSSIARRLGLAVTTATNGVDALRKLAADHFDLLISDFEMPRKDGLALIAEVRSNPETSGLYAVMLTAHDELSVKVTALTLGYDDFLAKGCTEVEVVAKVAAARRILARQHALDADAREWRDIANHDELTRVATRRFFFEQAERHLAQKGNIAVVLFDVNDFKAINDNYGHLAGDRVLKDMGGLFLRRTRSDDVIARYGGDEFVLLVLNLTVDETRAVAERLAAELSSLQWHERDTTLRVSVTIGMGCSSLIPGATIQQLLEVADQELYANKWLKKHPTTTPPDVYEYHDAAEPTVPAVGTAPHRVVTTSAVSGSSRSEWSRDASSRGRR